MRTGANIKRVLEFLIHQLAGLRSFRSQNSLAFHTNIFTMDRASANDLALKGMVGADDMDVPTLRLPCNAHIADTAQGRAYGTIIGDISGCIALSLYLQCSGAVTSFRQELAAVIRQSVEVCDAVPVESWQLAPGRQASGFHVACISE